MTEEITTTAPELADKPKTRRKSNEKSIRTLSLTEVDGALAVYDKNIRMNTELVKTKLSTGGKRIDVRWKDEEREHELTLTFHLPIVNDGITWREKENYEGHGRRAKRYDLYEGSNTTTLNVKKKDGRG